MMPIVIRDEPVQCKAQRDEFYRMSVARYHELVNSGMFDEGDDIELLQGFLINKMPINPQHSFSTDEIRDQLLAILPLGYFVKSQAPITLQDSEPEPDVFVVRGSKREFTERHPSPADVLLVVEVSNATLGRERGWKKEIYASAGIPVYWIVNLVDEQVEVYEGASEAEYLSKRTFQRDENVPVDVDGRTIAVLAVNELLP